AVVSFEDFDVVAAVQQPGGHVQQLEGGVDADAHVGGKHHGDLLAGRLYGLLALIVEAGGTDDALGTVPDARLQVCQRAFGTGEVDQAVGVGKCVEVVADEHARVAPEKGTGILPQGGRFAAGECDGEVEVGAVGNRVDQHAAH